MSDRFLKSNRWFLSFCAPTNVVGAAAAVYAIGYCIVVAADVANLVVGNSYGGIGAVVVDVVVMDMDQIKFANRNNLAAADVAKAAKAPFGFINMPKILKHTHTLG